MKAIAGIILFTLLTSITLYQGIEAYDTFRKSTTAFIETLDKHDYRQK